MYNKVAGKTCFILSCPQIRSSLCRLDIGQDGKLWTPFIHPSVSFFMKITDAKYRQKYFTDFTTVDTSVLFNLNTKNGASDHMESLRRSGQISNAVISKTPCQIGGENSHATDPGKPKGSHWLEAENRDSIPYSDRGSLSHATDPGKPKGSHWLEAENRDSIPSSGRGSLSHATDPGKPEGSHWLETENRDSIPTRD